MPSHEVAVSRTVAATPTDVWSVLSGVARWPGLLRQVERVELLTEGQYAPGTRWRETRSESGREFTQELWVTEVDPPWWTVVESAEGDFTYRLEHRLEVSGDHTDSRPRTRITARLRSEQPGEEATWVWRVLGALGSRGAQEALAQDLADIAAAVERPETRNMVIVHRLFTRELAAGPDLVRGVPEGNVHRARIVADHLTTVLTTLVDHHYGEDLLIWPLLEQRTAVDPGVGERLAQQHATIHADIAVAREWLVRWRELAAEEARDRLAELLDRLGEDVRNHLEAEENEVLPLIERHLTRVEYERLVAYGRATLPRDKAALLVQLFLEGTNRSERALLLGDFPPAMQVFIRTVGARQYRRYVRRLRAG